MYDIAESVSRVANETYSHTRKIMPQQPWWNYLESSFHKFPDDFELDLRTDSLVQGTAVGDVMLRTAAASLLSSLALPFSLWPAHLKHDASTFDYYQGLADSGDANTNFPRPNFDVSKVRWQESGLFRFRPESGSANLLSFESPYLPKLPSVRERFLKNHRNRTAYAQYWRHNNGPRPTICLIHGFMADPYWLNRKFFALPWFYAQGYDILLYTLPHHGRRQQMTAPFSGHGFFANGIAGVNEAMFQAVHDFRIFIDLLQANGVKNIGVTGISLGGYTTALLASVEERLQFAIPNVPLASMVDTMLEWFPMSAYIKAVMKATGTSVHEARHWTAVHSALTYKPKLEKERLMIIAGAGDRLASPKHARLLWDHWDRPNIHWFPGNHIIHLDKGKYLKEMVRFMKDIGFDKQ